jgi:hypothetical protein
VCISPFVVVALLLKTQVHMEEAVSRVCVKSNLPHAHNLAGCGNRFDPFQMWFGKAGEEAFGETTLAGGIVWAEGEGFFFVPEDGGEDVVETFGL